MRPCGMCGGPLGLLGVLGKLAHYQCRNCGAAYSRELETDIYGDIVEERLEEENDDEA
jgi:hypothetical protein